MGRARRVDVGGTIYHALNRANFRSRLFREASHYEDFLGIVEESLNFVHMRILAYCLMPNHWHLVLYPRADGDLSKFLRRLTLTHTQRYHARTRTVGYGHVYQGRYKSLLVESDRHFLTLVRYVERNAKQKKLLSPWPRGEPRHYREWLNQSQGKEEIENIRSAIKKGRPYGSEK